MAPAAKALPPAARAHIARGVGVVVEAIGARLLGAIGLIVRPEELTAGKVAIPGDACCIIQLTPFAGACVCPPA